MDLPPVSRSHVSLWTYRRQVGGTEARLPTKEVNPTLKSLWDFVLNHHIPRVTGDVGLRCSWVFPRTSETGCLTGYRRRLQRALVSVGYDRRRVSDGVCGLPRPSSYSHPTGYRGYATPVSVSAITHVQVNMGVCRVTADVFVGSPQNVFNTTCLPDYLELISSRPGRHSHQLSPP